MAGLMSPAPRPWGARGRHLLPAIIGTAFLLAVAALLPGHGTVDRAAAAGPLKGQKFLPSGKKMFHGVSDTADVKDFKHFEKRVKHHPAVLQVFYHWDVDLEFSGAYDRWAATKTLGMVSLSTKNPARGGDSMPLSRIASGREDKFIIRLNRQVAKQGLPIYYRLFPEMNGHWNPYSAYNADGSKRGSKYSKKNFIKAWRRIVTIARGGSRIQINKRLRKLGMPRLHRAGSDNSGSYDKPKKRVPRRLERAPISFMWVPQTFGSPNIPGNQPQDYWPGKKYVDWVGADIFSKYQSAFPHLDRFYRKYSKKKKKPFVIGEYSPWDNDYNGAFTKRLMKWAKKNGRVRMLVYYRSVTKGTSNPHYITKFPKAKRQLRRQLTNKSFEQYPKQAANFDLKPYGGGAALRD